MPRSDGATRARVLEVAAELFGRHGYTATTVAQIEKAAGLSPGSGGLYRHFSSKKDLLQESLRRQVDTGPDLATFMPQPLESDDVRARLRALAGAGLRRLEHERDLNRLLLHDLRDFPDLLQMVRDSELRRVHDGLTRWLTANAEPQSLHPPTVAAILMGAVSHYWIMRDVFDGLHPLDIHEEVFLDVIAEMAAAAIQRP